MLLTVAKSLNYFMQAHRRGTAAILETAITNHRKAKKLMKAWEDETEKLFDAKAPRKS